MLTRQMRKDVKRVSYFKALFNQQNYESINGHEVVRGGKELATGKELVTRCFYGLSLRVCALL